MYLQQLEELAGEEGVENQRHVRGQKKKQNRYLEQLEELVGGDWVEHQRHIRGQRRDAKDDYKQQPLRPLILLKRLQKFFFLEKWKKMGGICVLKEKQQQQQQATLVFREGLWGVK